MIYLIRAVYDADMSSGGYEVIHWSGVSGQYSESNVKEEVRRLNQTKSDDVSYYEFITLPSIPLGQSHSEKDLESQIPS